MGQDQMGCACRRRNKKKNVQTIITLFDRVENIVRKGENAGHFSHIVFKGIIPLLLSQKIAIVM